MCGLLDVGVWECWLVRSMGVWSLSDGVGCGKGFWLCWFVWIVLVVFVVGVGCVLYYVVELVFCEEVWRVGGVGFECWFCDVWFVEWFVCVVDGILVVDYVRVVDYCIMFG